MLHASRLDFVWKLCCCQLHQIIPQNRKISESASINALKPHGSDDKHYFTNSASVGVLLRRRRSLGLRHSFKSSPSLQWNDYDYTFNRVGVRVDRHLLGNRPWRKYGNLRAHYCFSRDDSRLSVCTYLHRRWVLTQVPRLCGRARLGSLSNKSSSVVLLCVYLPKN